MVSKRKTGFEMQQARRSMLRVGASGLLAVGLVACGGGGGGDDSNDSKDLKLALDRLKPGMDEDEINAAVGWPPNEGRLDWSHNGYLLLVSLRGENPSVANTRQIIDAASLSAAGIGTVSRRY